MEQESVSIPYKNYCVDKGEQYYDYTVYEPDWQYHPDIFDF